MKSWQFQDAKIHFNEMIEEAITRGPQEITMHSKPTAVILSKKEYEKLTKLKPSFVDFLRQSLLVGIKIKIIRGI